MYKTFIVLMDQSGPIGVFESMEEAKSALNTTFEQVEDRTELQASENDTEVPHLATHEFMVTLTKRIFAQHVPVNRVLKVN